MGNSIIDRISDGRTDAVFDLLAAGQSAGAHDNDGVAVIQKCAYYGDVSAIRFLLKEGESLASLGENFGLHGAAFHGHWRLVQFLVENGADVNLPEPETSETPLHVALCKAHSASHTHVVRVLLSAGANANCKTNENAETGAFMRDSRTKAETPLHRAAAFGTEEAIQHLLDAGARVDAKDMHGDSPLSWASWYLRPATVLRKLLHGEFRIHPNHVGMEVNLLGKPNL